MPRKKKQNVPGPRRKYHYAKQVTTDKKEESTNRTSDSCMCSAVSPTEKRDCVDIGVQTEVFKVVESSVQTVLDVVDSSVQTLITTVDGCVQTFESESDHAYAYSECSYDDDVMEHTHSINVLSESEAENYFHSINVQVDKVVEECDIVMDHACTNSSGDNLTFLSDDLEITCIEIEVDEVLLESLSFKDFATEIREHTNDKYTIRETKRSLTLLQFYKESGPVESVKLAIEFSDDFKCNVSVHRQSIPKSHPLWIGSPEIFHDKDSALKLIEKLQTYTVCCGNPEQAYQKLVPVGVGLTNSGSTDIVAYREGDFGAVTSEGTRYSSTIRSSSCELLTPRKLNCIKCKNYSYALVKRKKRLDDRIIHPRKFSHSSFKHSDMTRDELCLKLKEQKGEISDLTNTVWKLKRQYENSIRNEGVSVKEHESLELSSLMDSCSEQFKRGFPDGNSRQRLFWEQQELYANKPDKRGMRWHPMIIRWCLFLRQKSQAAYDAISESGFIKLPSSRTLYDYSHFLNSDLGFQKDAFELANKEAEKNGLFDVEWRRNVGLLFDEVKIHEDLVFDKHTGELVGYCNLGDIANQMMKFDTAQKETGAQSLAKQVLVVMLRSVYGNMCYPLCAFATNTITSDFLYPLIWQTVDAVQTGLKLRVLFFTCDGASPNRRFFHLHRVGNEELVFRTVNPNESDHFIYFISDVPHLVKTLRNNLSNSYSHNKSRTLWRNGKDISWMHVVRLFEEHCETSLYNACPRLTRKHVYLQSFNYMKVNLAAQVLSSSVANAMQDLCGPETEETVLFLKTFDKFFDCLNVRSVWEGRNSRNPNMNPYRDRDDPRLEFLTVEVITYLNDWEQQVNNRRGPFTKTQRANMLLSYQTLEGIKLAIHAISSCVKFLLEEGADYVLTNRFNQDPLEQHFGHYRLKCGSNRNPSVYEVRNVLRTIRAVNSQAIGTKRGNTQRDPVDVQTIDNAKIPRRK